jgi:hypothetical protein
MSMDFSTKMSPAMASRWVANIQKRVAYGATVENSCVLAADAEMSRLFSEVERLTGQRDVMGEQLNDYIERCRAAEERARASEDLLSQLVEWYDKYCQYLSGGGLGTLAHIIRASRKEGGQ